MSFSTCFCFLSNVETVSELKELVEKQSELILDLNTKIEECHQSQRETSQELEHSKMENVKLKVELSQQNTKFEKMFESLEQEGISIKNTVSKQKVGIEDLISKYEKHDEVLRKLI